MKKLAKNLIVPFIAKARMMPKAKVKMRMRIWMFLCKQWNVEFHCLENQETSYQLNKQSALITIPEGIMIEQSKMFRLSCQVFTKRVQINSAHIRRMIIPLIRQFRESHLIIWPKMIWSLWEILREKWRISFSTLRVQIGKCNSKQLISWEDWLSSILMLSLE